MSSVKIKDLLQARKNFLEGVQQTGYPHIDNRHLQYYSSVNIIFNTFLDCQLSMFDLVSRESANFEKSIAIDYFGAKVNYSDFINNIILYSQTFLNMGIKYGEVVSIASPNLPEIFYAIYGLNRIGAVANLIDPRNNADRIKQYINQVNSTRLIMIDVAYPKIDKLIHDTGVKEVYTVSPTDSLPLGLNYIQKAKTLVENYRKGLPNCPKNEMYHPLVECVNEYNKKYGISFKTPARRVDVGDEVAIIVNTSGTTGTPKGVMLTNENLNAVALDYKGSGMEYDAGDKFLGIMPNFLAYGIGVGMHMTFALGLTNVVIPQVTLESFPKLIKKHHPVHFAGTPSHFQSLIEDKKMRGVDLSFIKTAAAGGDSMDPELKRKTNIFLAEHNCPGKIKVGYGCTENTGLATSQFYVGESTEDNELQTVGIPALNTTVRIISPETHKDLKYDEDGEILLGGNGVMKGYANNPVETAHVIEEIDGKRYLHTGDIGHVDKNGCLYVVDRIKRIIVRPDGHNVFPSYIEKVVNTHPCIKKCACAGVKDKQHINGKIPVAFIVIERGHETEVEKIIEELKAISLEKLPERDVALDYVVVDDIPLTPNGKVDYLSLEQSYSYTAPILARKK